MAVESKLLPLGLRVVVIPQPKEEKTAGGLFVPPTAQDDATPQSGQVIKLGTGEEGKKFEVAVGDTVYFKKYGFDEVEIEGVDYIVVHQDDILAIVK